MYYALLQMEFMGVMCRDAVNDCDIPENCTGNSSQVSMCLNRWDLQITTTTHTLFNLCLRLLIYLILTMLTWGGTVA